MNKPSNGKSPRLDWGYHYVSVPLALIIFVWSIVNLVQEGGRTSAAWLLLLIALCFVFVVTKLRTYATKTQDRIIRMEEQFRHHRLTGKMLNPKLTPAQIIALRNAEDEEFPALCEKAALENLSPEQIRRAIQNWRPDTMRI
jgi:hypothetical protein